MAVVNSSLTKIYLDGVAIGKCTGASLSITVNGIVITNKDSNGWEEEIDGVKSWEISGTALVDTSESKTSDDIFTLITGRTTATVKYMNNTSGQIYYQGTGRMRALNFSHGTEESGTFDFTIKGTSTLSQKTLT